MEVISCARELRGIKSDGVKVGGGGPLKLIGEGKAGAGLTERLTKVISSSLVTRGREACIVGVEVEGDRGWRSRTWSFFKFRDLTDTSAAAATAECVVCDHQGILPTNYCSNTA